MADQEIKKIENRMKKTIDATKMKLSAIRAGKANIGMLDGIMVDSYGMKTPLSQVANLSNPTARTLVISPWDKSAIKAIEKGLQQSNLGLTPSNDGVIVRIQIPELTADRRKDYLKLAKKEADDGKVAIRNIRKDGNNALRKMQKDSEISEDDLKGYEKDVQDLTNDYTQKIDKLYTIKEKDIKTI